MLTLVMLFVAGQVSFVEQSLPGIVIGNVTPFTGEVTTNFLHADVDGDGDADMFMVNGLYVQDEGLYGSSPTMPLPVPLGSADADIFNGQLFYREQETLSVYACEDSAWKQTLRQNVEWPGGQSVFRPNRNPTVQFRRFLHDLNGDGVPELVAVDQRGVHVFRRAGDAYVPAGIIALPAIVSVGHTATQQVWPDDARNIVFPEQQMSCRMVFDEGFFRTITIRERKRDTRVFTIQTQSLVLDDTGNYGAQDLHDDSPEALPAHLRPCRLNGDDVLDFAGGQWLNSNTSPMPIPLYESWATLDGGATFHVRRTAAFAQFRPHCNFIDFDSDGDMDFVTESTQMPRGSIREQLNRFLSEPTLDHEIAVYSQSEGKFSDTPDLRFTTRFTLESPPVSRGAMLARYESGILVNLTGDVDGDGYHDLLLRTDPHSLSLYIAEGWKGFRSRPSWTLEIAEDQDAFVADINGDGLSDIYISRKGAISPEESESKVYFARRGQP